MADFKNYAVANAKEVEEQAMKLVKSPAYRYSKVRLMADAHAGKASCIGFTATISDKVVPFTVGVDIACRVSAFEIVHDSEIELEKLDAAVYKHVPSGFAMRNIEHRESKAFPYEDLCCWKDICGNEERYRKSMGTLGGGNHFIAVECGETGDYLLVHSGSRNLGLKVANYYQDLAIRRKAERIKERHDRYNALIAFEREKGHFDQIQLLLDGRKVEDLNEPENDLCYLEGQDMEDYLHDVELIHQWSFLNHKVIAESIFDAMGWEKGKEITSIHNYVDTEHKIVRKGAIAAYDGQEGIIPLNMADGSLLVVGKGNKEYNCSAPHGAGRLYSRKAAKAELSMDDYKRSMDGIYTSCVCENTLDESQAAYKPADLVIDAIAPTVDIIDHLRPIYNFKAKE